MPWSDWAPYLLPLDVLLLLPLSLLLLELLLLKRFPRGLDLLRRLLDCATNAR